MLEIPALFGSFSPPDKWQKDTIYEEYRVLKNSISKDANYLEKLSKMMKLRQLLLEIIMFDPIGAVDKNLEYELWHMHFRDAISQIRREYQTDNSSPLQAYHMQLLDEGAGMFRQLLAHFIAAKSITGEEPAACVKPESCYDLDYTTAHETHEINRRRYKKLVTPSDTMPCKLLCRGRDSDDHEVVISSNKQLKPLTSDIRRHLVQYCLVHLGDLARYRHADEIALLHYQRASEVDPHSGHAYNQLAILSSSSSTTQKDSLASFCNYVRAVCCKRSFQAATGNLEALLDELLSQDHYLFNYARLARQLPPLDVTACPYTSSKSLWQLLVVHIYACAENREDGVLLLTNSFIRAVVDSKDIGERGGRDLVAWLLVWLVQGERSSAVETTRLEVPQSLLLRFDCDEELSLPTELIGFTLLTQLSTKPDTFSQLRSLILSSWMDCKG